MGVGQRQHRRWLVRAGDRACGRQQTRNPAAVDPGVIEWIPYYPLLNSLDFILFWYNLKWTRRTTAKKIYRRFRNLNNSFGSALTKSKKSPRLLRSARRSNTNKRYRKPLPSPLSTTLMLQRKNRTPLRPGNQLKSIKGCVNSRQGKIYSSRKRQMRSWLD